MSGWEGYIEMLKRPGADGKPSLVELGAIIGKESKSVYASSTEWAILPEEIKVLTGPISTMQQSGAMIAGHKYRFIRDMSDDPSVLCITFKSKQVDGVSYPLAIGVAKTVLIVARGSMTAQGGDVTTKVHAVTEYLKSVQC